MRTKILKYFGMVVVLIIMVNLTSCEVSIESWYDDDDYSEIYYRTTRELCSRTKEGRIINYRILERIATRTSLIIDFGGGLKQEDDLEIAFESGAQMVTGGSIAVKNPEMFTSWISKFGSEKIILGADAKEKKIAISGWEETTSQELIPFIKGYYDKGITKVICTDIARDGMLQGPAIDLYKEIRDEIPFLYIIASGGVSSIEDIEKLSEAGIPAVIFGKAIYEGKIQLKDLLRFT